MCFFLAFIFFIRKNNPSSIYTNSPACFYYTQFGQEEHRRKMSAPPSIRMGVRGDETRSLTSKSSRDRRKMDEVPRENKHPVADATCRSVRKSPPASPYAEWASWAVEVVIFIWVVSLTATVVAQLDGTLDLSISKLNILIGTTGILFVTWAAFTYLAAAVNYANERRFDLTPKAEQSKVVFMCVLPQLRWGIIFVTAFMAAYGTIGLYIWRMIDTDGISILTDEVVRRQLRWHLWQFVLTGSVFILCFLSDYYNAAEAYMIWTTKAHPCTENTMFDGLENDDWWRGLMSIFTLFRVLVGWFAVAQILYLSEQLWLREKTWSPDTWRLTIGTTAGIILGLMTIVVLLTLMAKCHPETKKLECLRRYQMRAFWFTAVFGFGIGTIWYELWLFIDQGRSPLKTEVDRQRFDNLLWVYLIALSNMLFQCHFGDVRCLFNSTLRKGIFPLFHDL